MLLAEEDRGEGGLVGVFLQLVPDEILIEVRVDLMFLELHMEIIEYVLGCLAVGIVCLGEDVDLVVIHVIEEVFIFQVLVQIARAHAHLMSEHKGGCSREQE